MDTPLSQGLWTPPPGRTPVLKAQEQPKSGSLAPLATSTAQKSAGAGTSEGEGDSDNMVLDFSTSPPDSRPGTSLGHRPGPLPSADHPSSIIGTLNSVSSSNDTATIEENANESDHLRELPPPGEKIPTSLSRGLSQEGLWGNKPSGDKVERAKVAGKERGGGRGMGRGMEGPKRRWTVDERE